MGKVFIYPKWVLFLVYGIFILFPLLVAISMALIGFPQTKEDFIVFAVFAFLLLFMFLSIVLWLWNLSKTRFYLNQEGIIYNSLFLKIIIEWADISEIRKKYYYGGKFGGPPKDLEITTKAGKRIKVFHFLVSEELQDMEEGIKEFENEIRQYTKT